jgi:DNA-binding transcriptional LysR family regulator
MPKLTLEAIQVMDAIDRYGSFAAAAEQLFKVPSAISYTVTKLEERLGLALFERNGPKITATQAGRELLLEGRILLSNALLLENRLSRIATGFESQLRFTLDSVLPMTFLTASIAQFMQHNCGTRLRFSHEVMTGVWEALIDDRADVIVAGGEPHPMSYSAQIQTHELAKISFVFCVAPMHPLALLQREVLQDDLNPHTAIVVADTARSLPSRTVGFATPQNHMTVPNMAVTLEMQLAGLGYGFVPTFLAKPYLDSGELIALATQIKRPPESLILAWRNESTGAALDWWVTQLTEMTWPAL